MKSTLDVGQCDKLGSTNSIEMRYYARHGPGFAEETAIKSVTVVNRTVVTPSICVHLNDSLLG